MSNSVEQYK